MSNPPRTPSPALGRPPTTSDELRRSFLDHFTARGHTEVASGSLIPHDPGLLFTVAGMVPFKPYFTGDETPPFKRATTSQKCARAGGKHNDLDDVGRTARHLVFFEMLGNFSFGDYFKSDAITYAWDFTTNTLGFDPEQLWVTVHESDDEAEALWLDLTEMPKNRIQRLGDKDNFWQMGPTGPCGPCSEIYIDRGAQYGPEGGPLNPHAEARFLEFWNLVFMQFDQAEDGTRTPLPKPSIDTGAGLERILCLRQNVEAVWETDLMAPIIDRARSITGAKYVVGDYDDADSFSLRVLAEHARSSAMLIGDDVFPSNNDRGYVLRQARGLERDMRLHRRHRRGRAPHLRGKERGRGVLLGRQRTRPGRHTGVGGCRRSESRAGAARCRPCRAGHCGAQSHVCAHRRSTSILLGRERVWSARRRNEHGQRRCRRGEACWRRRHRCGIQSHLRHLDRQGALLGGQRLRSARRRYAAKRVPARRRVGRCDRCRLWRQPFVCAFDHWHGVVLGQQRGRPAGDRR